MIKKIILFFKKILIKDNKTKEIEAPIGTVLKKSNNDFWDSLKSSVIKKKKREVETQVCVGDGLGIQNKINY